jgi:hypothetical protein
MPTWFQEYAADIGGKRGTLPLYQAALKLRRSFRDYPDIQWEESGNETVHLRRGRWQVMTNFSRSHSVKRPPGRVVLQSSSGISDDPSMLPPCATIWVEGEQ